MKTFLTVLILSLSLHSFSQNDDRRERIKALKVAYITEQLELTTAEAEKFWPVYNAYEEQEQQLRNANHSKRKEKDLESMSEQEAKHRIDDMLSSEKSRHEFREIFIKDLQKFLSSKKILKLKIAEDQFNKRMFEEFKRRRDARGGKS